MTSDREVISVATDFTRFPAGRYETDGLYSGQRFREKLLAPALRKGGSVVVCLDGTMGFGSSFLEEAFGGLARTAEFRPAYLLEKLELQSKDDSLIDEIRSYIEASFEH